MRRLLPSLLLLLMALGACRAPRQEGMSREKFVRVNVALRLVTDTGTAGASRRAAILRREHVTPAQLHAWVRDHRVTTLTEVWQEIAMRVDSAKPDSARVRRPRGAQTDLRLPPPPSGGPQDSLIRPTPYRMPDPDDSLIALRRARDSINQRRARDSINRARPRDTAM